MIEIIHDRYYYILLIKIPIKKNSLKIFNNLSLGINKLLHFIELRRFFDAVLQDASKKLNLNYTQILTEGTKNAFNFVHNLAELTLKREFYRQVFFF